MVKASAGGGGRGLRIVREPDALGPALEAARAEAASAFGDGRLLIERALLGARHVEVQVFGDEQGNIVHLGERDCSIQRRHQKVIEEAPSPAVSPALRREMGEAAVRAARAVGYVGAGTVEFLLDAESAFYFLEMNTRIQVEHPVTEAVTGLDLVRLQLQVAQGRALPFAQSDVRLAGHAIEARLYAEGADFLPSTGRLVAFRPGGDARIEAGVETGSVVTPFYDSMLAKLIAHGATREEARARTRRRAGQDIRRRRRDQPRFPRGRARPSRLRGGQGHNRLRRGNALRPRAAEPARLRACGFAARRSPSRPDAFGRLARGARAAARRRRGAPPRGAARG